MKKSISFLVYTLSAILMSLLVIVGCSDDDPEPKFSLNLEVYPEDAGDVSGAGDYLDGEQVNIEATSAQSWEFLYWSGDTDNVEDTTATSTIVTIPSAEITITAYFQIAYPIFGEGATDIDGNEYNTVIIGNQEWMAENLRTTRYSNGDIIPTNLGDDWSSTTIGAYAIFDHNHEDTDGIDSPEAMVEAYGKLYNWYAVDDERGLCPEGWRVPTAEDWDELVDHLDYLGFPYDALILEGAGNMLKSCYQVGSPLDDCDTFTHPRWNEHDAHYGFDAFGFSALPSGRRMGGNFQRIGETAAYWTSSKHPSGYAYTTSLGHASSEVWRGYASATLGRSVRCINIGKSELKAPIQQTE